MKSVTNNKISSRVLATKKLSVDGSKRAAPLKFKQISDNELKSTRNSAYSYLVR